MNDAQTANAGERLRTSEWQETAKGMPTHHCIHVDSRQCSAIGNLRYWFLELSGKKIIFRALSICPGAEFTYMEADQEG